MGYPKALLPFGAGTFMSRILAALAEAGLPGARVVLNEETARSLPHRAYPGAEIILNPDPQRGQISSMQLALENLEPGAGACLFWPVDLPAVSAGLVRDLVSLFRASRALMALPQCGGRAGHPVIIRRELFRELLDADPGLGAKPVVLRHRGETVFLETAEDSVLRDIDTPEDYERLTGETVEAALARASLGPCPAKAGAEE